MEHKAKLWAARIDEWSRSGLSQQQYCEENHLAVSTFGWWRKRLKTECEQAGTFVEIPRERSLSPTGMQIQISVGRYTIRMSGGVDAGQLESVLNVLDHR